MSDIAKIIIFYYEWPNTAGNHAGMAYFARCLKRDLPFPVKLICVPNGYKNYRNRFQLLWRYFMIRFATLNLNSDDVFFFMEYLGGRQCGDHRAIALDLRARGIRNQLIGLVHLPIQSLFKLYDRDYITSGLDALDKIVVFGSSLAKDLSKIGYGSKIRRTFHYVDTNYYHPDKKDFNSDGFNVISMGFLYRNRSIMKKIIQRCPDITFELCLGNNKELHSMFAEYPNVILHKFMVEEELLSKMKQADISLSIMDDTIGSNVIVTSMACGLPQVVSDIGSIRDYCSEENAIFCNDTDDFVNALKTLSKNQKLCQEMRNHARKKAETISLAQSINWYRKLFSSPYYEMPEIE